MYRLGWILLGVFYTVAGLNHFRDPEFYLPLIPGYFPEPELINILSGVAEIVLGLLVFPKSTRRAASIGIIILLVCFIPSHIHFIVEGGCLGKLCVPGWVAWVRLIVIHPLLIFWAWKYTGRS